MKYWLSWIVPLRFSKRVYDHEGGYSTLVWWQWADSTLAFKVHQ